MKILHAFLNGFLIILIVLVPFLVFGAAVAIGYFVSIWTGFNPLICVALSTFVGLCLFVGWVDDDGIGGW